MPRVILDGVESRSVSPVFVGRGRELAELADGLARARVGEPQAFVIGGEAGIGKTRLLGEFLTLAGPTDAVTAVGSCVELGADGLPFAPVAAVLRSLHRQLGPALTDAARGREGELARLLPELGEAGSPGDNALGRARLFELTTRLLERLAADRPLIVAVEDLHWSDRSTRELLGYLFRSVQNARLLVLATYRTDDIHRRHPLRPFLAELDRLRSVRRIELARFTRGEVRAQIAGITGSRPAPALLHSVFERSEGNPFFVEELTASDSPSRGISESLRDLLLVRVEALPEEAQDVLRIVAEGGSSVEHGLLAAVAERPEGDLLAALRAAVGAHLLTPTADGDGYCFRHALMREAVVDDLLPGERARLNRRFAEALERAGHLVPADQHAARLASYWYHAGDPARALPAVLDAAAQARRRYAYAEALRLLERALELWDGAPEEVRAALRPAEPVWGYPGNGTGGPVGAVDVLAEATMAGLLSGQPERARAMSKRALRLIDEREEPLPAAWFWLQRARMAEGLGRSDGRPELDRARELVRGLPPSTVHAQVLAHDAAWRSMDRPGPETFRTAERAVELARAVGARTTELYARITLACLRADAGEAEEGLAELSAVLDRLLRRGEVSLIGRCLVNRSAILAAVGRLREAADAGAEGMAVADRYGLEDTKGWLAANQSDVLVDLGRWDEADAAVATARRVPASVRPRAGAMLQAGRLAVLRGDEALARSELAGARAEIRTPDLRPSFTIELARLEVEVAASEGRIDAAREAFRAVTGEPFPSFTAGLVWGLLFAAAGAEAESRGLPGAGAGRGEALERIRAAMRPVRRGGTTWAAFGRLVDAQLARAEGRDVPGVWAEAVAALEPAGLPYHLAEARRCWAEALLGAEGPSGPARERAAAVLRPARAAARSLGARTLLRRVEQLAARGRLSLDPPAQEPAPASAPADPFGLTRRELDVLSLVAAGRSNRQIAQELFISPKTASVHVSNILAKLEVSGRGEAAALAHRLGLSL
ncbi:AAA family ATPase [Streptomyces sp. DSM 44917]|uniref:AAA family ATPase n=1 Tax=Streptomyces boetiae TaxID=3075541 RepID=A0ABU2L5F6_9ACTN|nr:AAA family ATPase [Streptomyces sp. DSM 44917]MDT0306801.1 AAA family ATPase [Streptomyces sp. DSM 44917]